MSLQGQAPPPDRIELVYPHVRHAIFDLGTAGVFLLAFGVRLLGWAIAEQTGTTGATLDLYDGGQAQSTPVFPVTLNPNESSREWFGPDGVRFETGVFADVPSGHVAGALFYTHHHH